MQNLKNLRLHNYPFGDGDWRAADQFEQNDPKKETIYGLEQISKLSIYQSKGKSSILLWVRSRIPTMKLKIPGKVFLKSESRTSVTFKL